MQEHPIKDENPGRNSSADEDVEHGQAPITAEEASQGGENGKVRHDGGQTKPLPWRGQKVLDECHRVWRSTANSGAECGGFEVTYIILDGFIKEFRIHKPRYF